MELKSFQHNGVLWKGRILGEKALLLEPDIREEKLNAVHYFTRVLEENKVKGVVDIVPAYESLAIIFDEDLKDVVQLLERLQELPKLKNKEISSVLHKVPVCYELGLDWEELENQTKLSKSEIVEIHSSKSYTVAMMGFIPGFVFLDGLESSISCPRKSVPRTDIPKGAVGIGRNQTGIYSLESPGGWNIIGRTPVSFFDINENPPTKLKAGDLVRFISISKLEFLTLTQ